QHIAEVIEPALAHGSVVLCDRFTDSTEAYQGSGRKLGSDPVLELHRVLCGDLQPDLTILLDSDAASVVSRARRRNKRASRSAGHDTEKNHQASIRFRVYGRLNLHAHSITITSFCFLCVSVVNNAFL